MNTAAAQRSAPAAAEDNMETTPTPVRVAEILGGKDSLAIGLTRAEVDQQIATAKQYPRSITLAVSNIQTLATMDEETAEECMYALPRGGKPITGPSARFAEIVRQSWGNNRVAQRVTHVGDNYVEAEGVYHDLESNSAVSAKVRRRILDKYGRRFSEDMIIVTGNAACSIAARNAVLGGIPKAVWRKSYDAVQSVISGDVATLAVTREKSLKAFAVYGVTPAQVFIALAVTGEADIKLEHIPLLRGMFAALKNGEATVEEMFPAPKGAGPAGPRPTMNESLDKLAGKIPNEKPAADAPSSADAAPVSPAKDTGPAANEVPAGQQSAASPSIVPSEPAKVPDALEETDSFKTFVVEKFKASRSVDELNTAWASYVEVVEKDLLNGSKAQSAALSELQKAFETREKEIGA